MIVYIVMYADENGKDLLAVFSTEEKAKEYKNFVDTNVFTTGISERHIVPIKVDWTDEMEDEWFEFNRDYTKYYDEKDI